MKQIDEYVNKVYRDMKGTKKEIQDLKYEMKGHLLESVHELKLEGKSDKEAVDIAINRFGKENELRTLINQVFQSQRIFGKRLLYTGLAVLLVSIIIFIFTIIPSKELHDEQAAITNEILDMLPREGELSESTEIEIDRLIKNAKYSIGTAVIKNYSSEDEVLYEYKAYENPLMSKLYSVYYLGTGNHGVFIESKNYSFLGLISLIAGGTTFILFTILWTIIKAYYKRQTQLVY